MSYWKKLFERIKRHLGQIPYIVFYPFAVIIEFLYGLFLVPYNYTCDRLNREKLANKKTERILKRTVTAILHGNSNLLNVSQNRYVAKLFTALLQFISFVTTYAGFTFFLGSLNPFAPLFLAFTVQGLCYYLMNYASSKKRSGAWKRIVLLSAVVLISITTSYIGVFDCMVNPIDEIRLEYNKFVVTANKLIDNEITEKASYTIDSMDVERIFNDCRTVIDRANEVVGLIEEHNNGTDTSQLSQVAWVDDSGNNIQTVITVDDPSKRNEINDMNTLINTINSIKDKINKYISSGNSSEGVSMAIANIIKNSTDDSKDDSDYSGAVDGKDYDAFNSFIEIAKELERLKTIVDNCYLLLTGSNIAQTDSNYEETVLNIDINSAISNSKKRGVLESLRFEDYKDVVPSNDEALSEAGEEKGFLLGINNFFVKMNEVVVSDELLEAEEIRKLLTETIEKKYTELEAVLQDNEDKQLLENAKNDISLDHIQVMPFTIPFKNNGALLGQALFSLAVAIIVDVLSLLISFTLVNKPKSILYYNNIRDMRKKREEFIESCLMYICLDDLNEELKKPEEIQRHVVETVNAVMSSLINRIHYLYVPDGLNSFGYLLFDEIPDENRYEKLLFQALNNAALLIPFHKSELAIVLKEEFDKEGTKDSSVDTLINKYDSLFSEDKICYLVSKNLHFWFCENFSELLQNSYLFITPSEDNKEVE